MNVRFLSVLILLIVILSGGWLNAAIAQLPQESPSSFTYFDDFSGYSLNTVPSGWTQYGTTAITPRVLEVGSGQRLAFPGYTQESTSKWLIKDGLSFSTVNASVQLNFQTDSDGAGLVLAWGDSNNFIAILPNPYWDEIVVWEFVNGQMQSTHGTGRFEVPIELWRDYWLKVITSTSPSGEHQMEVWWSTDGTTYELKVTADNLVNLTGQAGVGTYQFLSNALFDDFSISDTSPSDCSEQYYAEYYNNQTLSGSPAFVQCENWPIAHDWGINGPGNGLPSEGFSARWTGKATIQAGDYTFIYRADDGMRVWLNDELIIEDWDNPSLIEGRVTRYVSGGEYEIKVEYYENAGAAVAYFGWEQATPTTCAEQYRAEYYENQTLSGSPAFVQCENWPIAHDWGINGPGNGLSSEGFSARWIGKATIQAGDYTFIYRADDGMRVWLNDELIIEDWDNPSLIEGRVTRYVSGGEYEIKVEYYENAGAAVAYFGWEEATIDSIAPSGNIIEPPDDMTTGVGTVRFSASAWDNQGGSGVNRVDFEISYDNGSGSGWRTVGTSYAEPYYIDWQTPSGLYSQILNFRIRVTDNAGNVTENAGGTRSVIFYESQNNPNLTENWVPESRRAYLNQLSLSPNGDNKCGAASAAMVLAMNNLIGSGYQSMAAKANEIYIYNNPLPSLVNSLRTNGTIADFYYRSMDDAWTLIKDEVNNGRPVIILTERFSFGHYFVAVGYREEAGNRYLIAYDPLGQWQGSYGNYDYNFPQPDSYKGKWVQYNYNDAWGYQEPSNPIAGYGYLITARPQNQVANREVLGDIPDSPPDMVSDEPENLGVYEGIEVDTTDFSYKIHLPLVIR